MALQIWPFSFESFPSCDSSSQWHLAQALLSLVTAVELPPASCQRGLSTSHSFSPETAPRACLEDRGLWVPTRQTRGSQGSPGSSRGAHALVPALPGCFTGGFPRAQCAGPGQGELSPRTPVGGRPRAAPRPSGLLTRAAAAGSGLPRLSSEPLANTRGVGSTDPSPLQPLALNTATAARDRMIPARDRAAPARDREIPGRTKRSQPGTKRSQPGTERS